jgi:(p)ppGpp synthase/HD superfamily hydrolase
MAAISVPAVDSGGGWTTNLWRLPEIPQFARGSRLLEDAYELAVDAHCGSGRKGDTGIDHPTAVAELLGEQGFDQEIVAAGLLHDVLEDTDTDPGEIVERFGAEVGALVEVMTEDASIEPYQERKAEHRARVAGHSAAAPIYAADKLAKTRSLRNDGGEISDEKLDHYQRTLEALREAEPALPFLPELEENLRAIDADRQHATRR